MVITYKFYKNIQFLDEIVSHNKEFKKYYIAIKGISDTAFNL